MKQVLIDLNRLKKTEYNGLYQFSKYLGHNIAMLPQEEFQWNFYLPKNKFGMFGSDVKYILHKSVHKVYMPNTNKFDVWHVTNQVSWYRPFNNHTRVVFTIHDLNFLIDDKKNISRNKRLLKTIQERIDRCHHLTAISKFARQQVLNYLDTGDKPFSVIYNGCSVTEFPGFNQPVYRPLKPFLFSIGVVEKRKNFHVLPALLVGNNYELIIAGSTEDDYALKVISVANKMGVSSRLKLVGAVSEKDKFWYYKNCLAFCFPSYAEGFGLPVIEAMHFGKPVFLSTETCLPEIGGKNAYYFSEFDPVYMKEVFETGMHDYERSNAKESIITFAAKYNWMRAAEEYCQVYKQVLS
ncbi:MAG: glycosyltransferase family 1 protein [Bacteroidota bacterium]